jgi:hypothetical protein
MFSSKRMFFIGSKNDAEENPITLLEQPQDLTIPQTNIRTYIGHATWSVLDGLGRTSVKWEMSIDGSNWNTIGYSEREDGAISFNSIPREMDGYMFRATSYAYNPFTNLAENFGWPSGYETLALDGNSDNSGSAPFYVRIIGPPALESPCCGENTLTAYVQFIKSGEFAYNCSTASSQGSNYIFVKNLTKNLGIGYHTDNFITTQNFSVDIGDIIELKFAGSIYLFNISLPQDSVNSGRVNFLPNGITSRIMTLNVT